LTNEARPRANKLLDIFAGAKGRHRLARGRHGFAAAGQSEAGRRGRARRTGFLMTLLWMLLGVGIGAPQPSST
jgi:methyl-accepting chemotaxis protein